MLSMVSMEMSLVNIAYIAGNEKREPYVLYVIFLPT